MGRPKKSLMTSEALEEIGRGDFVKATKKAAAEIVTTLRLVFENGNRVAFDVDGFPSHVARVIQPRPHDYGDAVLELIDAMVTLSRMDGQERSFTIEVVREE